VKFTFLLVFLLSLSCSHSKRQSDISTTPNPKASSIEFQFTSESRKNIDSLKQAFARDSYYETDTIIQIEKSLWALGIKTRDSFAISKDEDSIVNLLSEKLTPIAERYHCELTGFANL
jgi:hypothetical protein